MDPLPWAESAVFEGEFPEWIRTGSGSWFDDSWGMEMLAQRAMTFREGHVQAYVEVLVQVGAWGQTLSAVAHRALDLVVFED